MKVLMMKIKDISFILIILLIFTGCLKNIDFNSRFFKNISDIENNDLFTKPNEVSVQSSIVGFFNKKEDSGDKDYYKIFFPQKYISYKMVASSVPAIDMKIVFYTVDGKKILEIDQNGRGEGEKLWEYYPTSDYVVLSIESKYGFNERIPYIINFIPKEESKIEEIEPNNDEENAIIISFPDVKKGLISPKNDIDYYHLIFKDNKNYNFLIKIETLSNLDINFTLYNKNLNKQKYINSYSWGGTEIFPYLSSKNGDFYIRVSGSLNENDKKAPLYYITIEEHKNEENNILFFEQEFNDDFETATDLITDSYIIGAYYPEDDIDFFRFDVLNSKNSVTISLSDVRGIDPYISIFDKKFNLIKKIDDRGIDRGEEIYLKDIDKDRYYISIKGNGSSLTYYKMFFNIRY